MNLISLQNIHFGQLHINSTEFEKKHCENTLINESCIHLPKVTIYFKGNNTHLNKQALIHIFKN